MTSNTTTTKQRLDWAQFNLPEEYIQQIFRWKNLETKMKAARVMGSAFLSFTAYGEASDQDHEDMVLVWHLLIEQDDPAWE